MDIQHLESRLAEIQSRLASLLEQAKAPGGGRSLEDILATYGECATVEREIALAKHDEAALPCKWEVPWDKGAPEPHVVASGRKTLLIYLTDEPDPNWDGTYVNVVDTSSDSSFPIALVEFVRCSIFKFGGPNDEVFDGLPLRHKGLASYGAYLIANSQWIAEQIKINSVHPSHNPVNWSGAKHYVLLFHDEMFECIARGHKIEVHNGTFEQVLEIARKRLFE